MNTRISQTLKHQLIPNAGTIAIVALLLVGFRAFAMPEALANPDPSPSGISYQGYLTDKDGKPLQGAVTLTFRLYAAESNAQADWEETHPNVPVNGGLFNVMLGSKNAIPASVWSNPEVYLGIDAGEGDMYPRQRVGRVPYALYADHAANVEHASNADYATTANRAYGLSAPDGTPNDAATVDSEGVVVLAPDTKVVVGSGEGVLDTKLKVWGDMSWHGTTMTYQVYYTDAYETGPRYKEVNLGQWDFCSILAYEVAGEESDPEDRGKCIISFDASANKGYSPEGPKTFYGSDQPNWWFKAEADGDVAWVKCEAICMNLGY